MIKQWYIVTSQRVVRYLRIILRCDCGSHLPLPPLLCVLKIFSIVAWRCCCFDIQPLPGDWQTFPHTAYCNPICTQSSRHTSIKFMQFLWYAHLWPVWLCVVSHVMKIVCMCKDHFVPASSKSRRAVEAGRPIAFSCKQAIHILKGIVGLPESSKKSIHTPCNLPFRSLGNCICSMSKVKSSDLKQSKWSCRSTVGGGWRLQ